MWNCRLPIFRHRWILKITCRRPIFYKSVRAVINNCQYRAAWRVPGGTRQYFKDEGCVTSPGCRPVAVRQQAGSHQILHATAQRSGGHRPFTPATSQQSGVPTATARQTTTPHTPPPPIIWRRQAGLRGIYKPRLLSYQYKVFIIIIR